MTNVGAFAAACKWALKFGWLEEDVVFACAERFHAVLTESEVDTVTAIALDRLAGEFPAGETAP